MLFKCQTQLVSIHQGLRICQHWLHLAVHRPFQEDGGGRGMGGEVKGEGELEREVEGEASGGGGVIRHQAGAEPAA